MDKIKSNNDKPYQTKDYFSFASPNKEYDKENGNTGNTGVKNNYPDSQLHPQFSYSSKTKVNKQKERNLRKEYIKQELNKSFRSGLKKDKSVDNSSKGEINASTSNDNYTNN